MSDSGQERLRAAQFGGLDCRAKCAAGSFVSMQNMTSQSYPVLSTRTKRGVVSSLSTPQGLTAKDSLIWCAGGKLYANGVETALTLTAGGHKDLVSMGAYLVIFPDKKYINTRDLSDYGSLENTVETTGNVQFSLCRADGTGYENYTISDMAPADPANGALWLDSAASPAALRQYNGAAWTEVTASCVKISSGGIGAGFTEGDGVTISGCVKEALNGANILCAVDDDNLVVAGLLTDLTAQTVPMTVSRTVPDMDYVTECGNRLWGCKYGIVDGVTVNEIYACKLGDFRNWNCFQGLSTDSYVSSRGGDGVFTGAVTYLNYPLFFREHSIEKVYPAASGAHQIVTTVCDGAAKGSSRSICVADGVLYYLGLGGVFRYDGSLPEHVSEILGKERYQSAVAGALDGRYYISMQDGKNDWQLFCYDTRRQLWHREDNTHAMDFAAMDDDLFCLTADGKVLSLLGSRGTAEDPVSWFAETGELQLDTMESRYLRRVEVRLLLAEGAEAHLYVSYDGGASWDDQGKAEGNALRPFTFFFRPKRSHLLRLRLSGRGDCQLYSICGVYQKGSDRT